MRSSFSIIHKATANMSSYISCFPLFTSTCAIKPVKNHSIEHWAKSRYSAAKLQKQLQFPPPKKVKDRNISHILKPQLATQSVQGRWHVVLSASCRSFDSMPFSGPNNNHRERAVAFFSDTLISNRLVPTDQHYTPSYKHVLSQVWHIFTVLLCSVGVHWYSVTHICNLIFSLSRAGNRS